MFHSTLRTLNILAAIVWYAGGIALVRKGVSLLVEAAELKPGLVWPWVAVGTAMIFGSIEAKFRFSRNCERNLARIAALEQPKIWQFFRPGFFVALAVMIAGGNALKVLLFGAADIFSIFIKGKTFRKRGGNTNEKNIVCIKHCPRPGLRRLHRDKSCC